MKPFVATMLLAVIGMALGSHAIAAAPSGTPKLAGASRSTTPGFTFIGVHDRVSIPFKLVNNNIYIHVKVNGHPLTFFVDTGGLDILTPVTAKRLGLTDHGATRVGSGGNKVLTMHTAKAARLTLDGKVILRDPTFLVGPLPHPDSDVKYDGMLGYPLFRQFVVRIDYASHQLTLIQPDAFHADHTGTPVPLTLYGGHIPTVDGSIDGLAGRFWIDTGYGGSVLVLSPFVHRHNMDTRYRTTSAVVIGYGAGGVMHGHVTRVGTLLMGAAKLENPVTVLSNATQGAAAMNVVAGDIGGRALKRFTVTFDYAHQRLYFKPNRHHDQPMHYGRAGFQATKTAHGFSVQSVMQDSPAALAGLHAGDLITAVNGAPASRVSSAVFGAMLRNDAPGTRVRFTIGSGAKTRVVTLTLRRLIPQVGGPISPPAHRPLTNS